MDFAAYVDQSVEEALEVDLEEGLEETLETGTMAMDFTHEVDMVLEGTLVG